VADQSALHGVIALIRDLGLPLLTVHRLNPGVSRLGSPMTDLLSETPLMNTQGGTR
jgi:hypothetical protein